MPGAQKFGHPKRGFQGISWWRHEIFKFLSDLIVQLYNQNESCQKCYFKQHWSPWSTFQDASFSPQESPKNFRFEKFIDKIDLIEENVSDLIIECFDRNKSCQKWYFKHLIFPWKTSYFAIFSLREPPKLTKLTNWMIFKSDGVNSNNTVHSFSRDRSWKKLCDK